MQIFEISNKYKTFCFIKHKTYAIVLVTVYSLRIIFWLSLANKWKCLVPNKNKLVFPSNHMTSCNSRQNNHNNNNKMTMVLLRRFKALAVVNYQPHQPHKTFKFPETNYDKQKRLRHLRHKFEIGFNIFIVTFMIILFILNTKCKYWITIFQHS